MSWDDYVAAWSGLHGGFDPRRASPPVRGWVLLAYRLGSLLGRNRIQPLTVTLAGLLLCLAVPVVIGLAGPAGLAVGALLVLLAAVADGLDGAVAVVTGRVTRAGHVYDSVADRLGEAAWLTAFWLAGAPAWLAVAAGAGSWLHEYLRARATTAGMTEIGTVTVGERPTRVAVGVTGLLLAPIATLVGPEWTAPALTVTVAIWLLLQTVGLCQLVVAVHRALR
ncbi:CDP-diacylglycerol--glycerol-3-phosphate 3-phosphatidyltransferase [Actinoplanes philippinensis]|uniref:CDP-diacylglycerol--glycerol-3-phosphate 3-phosphatidyltransferase n=1 Tax=Actinoplanes philippinensis TaxID=35752 RepID=A0A1I2BNT3_9ACTN|nr:CDP-alcohol phosphatidyltransferase family protein [Actinoplanes philippinensis]SFE57824.1 CDP-diacylglycerol--glycerol-3-phosphate 3-phosphatidyltransferase [Actinoplanes philippinensis]